MKTWFQKKEYLSPEIINEIIMLTSQTVLRQTLSEIKYSLWFALIADKGTDLSHSEHVYISVRWEACKYGIHKDTLGLAQLPDTNTQTIFGVIKDVFDALYRFPSVEAKLLMGGSNMSGTSNEVQALAKGKVRFYMSIVWHTV